VGKKGCPLERYLRDIYNENSVSTTAMTLLALEGVEAIVY
jgi:hypothetical protein